MPTPFYDLLCTDIYTDYAKEMAMSLDEEFYIENLRAYQFAVLAETLHISLKFASREMVRLCEQVPGELSCIELPGLSEDEMAFRDRLCSRLVKRAQHFLDIAEQIPETASLL